MESCPNVILFVFDTLRSDYLGCYNNQRTTPGFDRIARNGSLFKNGFSTAPGTPVSHASLFTGQYPSNHGVTGQYINLPREGPNLAEQLNQAGYSTYGITGPSKMGSDWGYDRGFDELFEPYYDLPVEPSLNTAATVLSNRHFAKYFLRQLTVGGIEKTKLKFDLIREKIKSSQHNPQYIFCNFLTVHAPYDPPRPYRSKANESYERSPLFIYNYLRNSEGRVNDPDIRLDRLTEIQSGPGVGKYIANSQYLNEKEIGLMRDWYSACVSYLDDQVNQFLDYYYDELSDDYILIMTADHGEQLGEKELWEHSYKLYDETLKVPLLMDGPGVPEQNAEEVMASHVDVFDTICDLCGIDHPDNTDGESLLQHGREKVFMEYGERDQDEFTQHSVHGKHFDEDSLDELCPGRKAVRTKKYRYEIASDGSESLYTLPTNDDNEGDDEVKEKLRRDLIDTLGQRFGKWPESKPDELDISEAVEDNLRNLGYIE